jgi:uridine kinase
MSKPYVIGITGGSGSGKTSLIRALRKEFSTEVLCIVCQDDYYHPREQQIPDTKGIRNFDLPTSVDLDALYEDLQQLEEGKAVKRKEYTFNNEEKEARDLVFKPAPVIIVEGLFVFADAKLFQRFDLSVFIHAKENLKVIRRIKRDQLERNYPLDDVLYRYQNHVLPAFEKFIAPFREEADLVINNNHDFNAGLEVLKAVVKHKNHVHSEVQ